MGMIKRPASCVAKKQDRAKRVALKKDKKPKLCNPTRAESICARAALTQLGISPHYYAGKQKKRESLSSEGCEILRNKVVLQPLRLISYWLIFIHVACCIFAFIVRSLIKRAFDLLVFCMRNALNNDVIKTICISFHDLVMTCTASDQFLWQHHCARNQGIDMHRYEDATPRQSPSSRVHMFWDTMDALLNGPKSIALPGPELIGVHSAVVAGMDTQLGLSLSVTFWLTVHVPLFLARCALYHRVTFFCRPRQRMFCFWAVANQECVELQQDHQRTWRLLLARCKWFSFCFRCQKLAKARVLHTSRCWHCAAASSQTLPEPRTC